MNFRVRDTLRVKATTDIRGQLGMQAQLDHPQAFILSIGTLKMNGHIVKSLISSLWGGGNGSVDTSVATFFRNI